MLYLNRFLPVLRSIYLQQLYLLTLLNRFICIFSTINYCRKIYYIFFNGYLMATYFKHNSIPISSSLRNDGCSNRKSPFCRDHDFFVGHIVPYYIYQKTDYSQVFRNPYCLLPQCYSLFTLVKVNSSTFVFHFFLYHLSQTGLYSFLFTRFMKTHK